MSKHNALPACAPCVRAVAVPSAQRVGVTARRGSVVLSESAAFFALCSGRLLALLMHVGVPTPGGCACRHPLLANSIQCCAPCDCMSQFDTGLLGDATQLFFHIVSDLTSSGGDEASSCRGGLHETVQTWIDVCLMRVRCDQVL